ncbi:MAG: adenylate/guanylate cyclase domain-containing protein [Pseudomonadota bacterium]
MRRVWRIFSWIGAGRFAGLIVLGFLLFLRVLDAPPIAALRNQSFDAYQQAVPRDYQPLPVTIIDIDDPSISELGQWPWPRTRIAEMVDLIGADGAAGIAFDIVFAEPDRLSPATVAEDNPDLPEAARKYLMRLADNDDILAGSFGGARVILGQTSVRSATSTPVDDTPPPQSQHAVLGPGPGNFLLRFPELVQNLPELEAAAAGRGVFSIRPDPDGVYRRVPMVLEVQGVLRLGLSAELLRVASGGAPFALRTNAAGIDGIVVAGQLIPTDAFGSIWPYLTPSRPDRFVPAADLLGGRMPQGRLAGHLVLVGTSAIGLEDFRATALGIPMAGVEIHAQALENILGGSLLIRPNYAVAVELSAVLGLGLLVIALTPVLGAGWIIVGSLGLLSSYAVASYYLFWAHRILFDPSYPLLATGFLVVLLTMANYLREEQRRRQIRGAFGQYVSPQLVEQLQKNPDRLTLGGEIRDLSILFSDVRGFTAISERFRDNPSGLTALMNRFLTVLSQPILETGGTIDKFMGDAVMAFWNAPLDQDDHAGAACRAALGMQAGVDRLNAERLTEAEALGEPPPPPLNVGIGINTGFCVVGNMGSDTRFDYTALGDAVNLASRFEGASAFYGLRVVVGSDTADAVGGRFALLELDKILVKGKREPEIVYGLLGDSDLHKKVEFQMLVVDNSTMLASYRTQSWDRAMAAAQTLRKHGDRVGLSLDAYASVYEDRIANLRANPPRADWDGVFIAETK